MVLAIPLKCLTGNAITSGPHIPTQCRLLTNPNDTAVIINPHITP
jgi:hypothetical protein